MRFWESAGLFHTLAGAVVSPATAFAKAVSNASADKASCGPDLYHNRTERYVRSPARTPGDRRPWGHQPAARTRGAALVGVTAVPMRTSAGLDDGCEPIGALRPDGSKPPLLLFRRDERARRLLLMNLDNDFGRPTTYPDPRHFTRRASSALAQDSRSA